MKKILTLMLLLVFPCVAFSQDSSDISQTSIESANKVSLKTRKIALESSVLVETQSGYGSGNYFKIDKMLFVITAAHVVDSLKYVNIHTDKEAVIGAVIFKDDAADYAVISVPKIESRKPAEFKKRSEKNLVGEMVCYAGFPNRQDLLFFTGNVSRVDKKVINIHSYGWMGASGSAVFDANGKLVGIISAVEVGRFGRSYQLIEDVVWLTPARLIDEKRIIETISKNQ